MKIIERGVARQVKCKNCSSVLEHEDSDIKLKPLPNSQRDWDSADREDAYGAYITCPVCGTAIKVNASFGLKAKLLREQDQRDNDI